MNDVHVAVQIPGPGSKLDLADSADITNRCVVVKTCGQGVDSHLWQQILNQYEAPLAYVNNPLARWKISDDGRLVNETYYPRTDLRRYLGLLQTGDFDIGFRFVAEWGEQLCAQVRELHAVNRVHNDIKPENILVNGLMKLGQTSLDGDVVGDLVLGDLDVISPPGPLGPFTPTWAAPEILDPNSPHHNKSSFSADVFSLGAVLLYILTGCQINREVYSDPETPDAIRRAYAHGGPLHGLVDAHKAAGPRILNDVLADFPDRLQRAVAKMLAPDPAARSDIRTSERLFGEAKHNVGDATFQVRIPDRTDLPVGLGPALIAVFNKLEYNLDGVH